MVQYIFHAGFVHRDEVFCDDTVGAAVLEQAMHCNFALYVFIRTSTQASRDAPDKL